MACAARWVQEPQRRKPAVSSFQTQPGQEVFTTRWSIMVAYADDVVILLQGKFPQTLCNLMDSLIHPLQVDGCLWTGS